MRWFLKATLRLLGLLMLVGLAALLGYVGYVSWLWNRAMKADPFDLARNGGADPLKESLKSG